MQQVYSRDTNFAGICKEKVDVSFKEDAAHAAECQEETVRLCKLLKQAKLERGSVEDVNPIISDYHADFGKCEDHSSPQSTSRKNVNIKGVCYEQQTVMLDDF
ncbi:unnamed protein product [Gongylonema pulchrum]|uniref:VWFD domain-containing protein n=1 Tax=Gongylonema pulchrum TaxID=637853 RepID=A0A183DA55_9BILA|nr:unnamed protein product [Gongylonema pulchrum]